MEYKKHLDFFTANVLIKMREEQTTCFLHFVVILKYTKYGKQGHVWFSCAGCRYKRWMGQQYTDQWAFLNSVFLFAMERKKEICHVNLIFSIF